MKWCKNLISLAVAIIFGLSLILVPVASQVSPVQAAITWTKSTTPVTLENERYVGDAWVIKDGDTYKMWYTHGKTDLSALGIVSAIIAAVPDSIISNIVNLALVGFSENLSSVNVTEIKNLLDGSSTVIGYATSSNRVTWTKVNSEVLAGSGADWSSSVGAPCVIWDVAESKYKMWYTRVKSNLTQANLETILTNMGQAGQRKDALLDLLNSTSTVIGYATSDNGSDWDVQDAEVLSDNGSAWNSVGDPCVIKDGDTYKMWYTRVKTDLTQANLDALDAATFGIDDLVDILDGTSTVIGYATSDNGSDWDVQDAEVLAGSGGAWDSVANPSVIKDGDTYRMWYTQGKTNLTKANLRTLINQIADLANTFWNILDAFNTGNITQLLYNLSALNISTIKSLLSGTSTVIGYATWDGVSDNWSVQNSQVLPETSGGAWDSVADPSVIKDGDTYYMWYTEGIDDLTVVNLLNLVLGTDLPIGYAYYSPRVVAPPEVRMPYMGIPPASPGVTDVSDLITAEGIFTEDVTAESFDGKVELTIDEGTIGLIEGEPLSEISITEMEEPPAPPADSSVIGLVYDFGPDGATFEPPITLTFTYDPAEIPEGVAEEDLVAAYYDEEAGEWVECEYTCDPETHCIMAYICHFTAFSVLAYTRPAAFTTSALTISPFEVDIGKRVTISTLITNTGDLAGNYEVTLKINNLVVAIKYITLAAGDSQKVTFTTAKDVAGTYAVNVDGLSGIFTVKVPPAPPKPAAFTTSALTISPTEVGIGERVTISVLVANTGDLSGSYTVTLRIDDVVVATDDVTLAGGANQEVTFTTVKDVVGTYQVEVDGLSGTFMVKALPKPINWWLIGGIIAACIALVAVISLIVTRRRRRA